MALQVLVYRPGAIGDTILTLPALAALRRRYPAADITWAGNDACLPLLSVARTMSADDRRLLPLFADRPEPLADVHIIFARQPVGLPGIQRDPLAAPGHVVDWLVDAVDEGFQDRMPGLEVEGSGGAQLVIHPGAGGAAKRWPASDFEAVVAALGVETVVVQGPADPPWSGPQQTWHNLPLVELARRLKASRLFIGNDSGISHLAAAVGTPTVAVYVSTDPERWGVRGARTRRAAPDLAGVLRAARSLLG